MKADPAARLVAAACIAVAWALAGSSAIAQEPDSTVANPRSGHCALTWEPLAPDTRLLALREAEDAHVSHVSGRMLWTCGTATMEADSAVKYDLERRVDLVGNVVYRDTIRSLDSDFLTYFELQDRVVATGQVRLVRTADGSTLEGPRVEFLRAVSGINEQTIATERPHMTLYPEGDRPGEPFGIDADRAVFAGEEEARAYGYVVIHRDDLEAEADSAYLRRTDESGVLWGSPWVEAQGIRLEGDTIRFRSEDGELREVRSLGNGHAVGESFDVVSDVIDVAIAEEEVETVWAYGEGLGEALSAGYRLYGDSLRFAMFEGKIDTVYAVGEAVAVEADERAPIASSLAADSLAAVGDSAVVAVPDSTVAAVGDSAVVAVPDSTVAAVGDSAVAAIPDSSAERSGGVRPPRLSVDGRTNWVRGDTLIAVFERPGESEADSTGAAIPPAADSTADPVIRLLIVIGEASSFYRQVRDSTQTDLPSFNYMRGRRIEIRFADGEPDEVRGLDAIGVYLDPLDPGEAPRPSLPDSVAVPPDSVAVIVGFREARGPRGSGVPPSRGGVRDESHWVRERKVA